MRYKLLLTILLVSPSFIFSQTEKKITAVLVCNDFALQGIEIANLDSKNTSISDGSGSFSIMAKAGDQLMFISKNYEYKTISLKEADFLTPNLVIALVKKPEELDEVVITNSIKAPKVQNMQGLLDTLYPDDQYSQKNNPLIDNGRIIYGPDIFRIVGKIVRIFVKEKEKTKEDPEIKFIDLVNNSLDQSFFIKTLKLKPEEIELFLDYCDAEPNSKNVLKNPNSLQIMEFLMAKNVEFKKLPKNKK